MVRGFNSECVPKHVPSTCEQAHRSLGRAPPHRPLMNSHAHAILELPVPKEVSMIWDLNLSASFSSQEGERERDLTILEDLNTLPCRVRVVLNLFSVSMVRGFNSECVPRHVPSTREQAHRSLARAPPHRPLMSSHPHVILETART